VDESLPRHAVEPESVIAEAVCAIEPDLDQGLVEKVVTDTFRYSPQRRQLALLLQQDPAWLTDGHVTADAVALRLGSFPAQMPPPLDELLLALHADAMAGSTAAERWLFPGRYPGRPLSRSQVMRRLHALGIRPRMARSTALVELASELPAVVVSRLLGVHQTTADTWKRIGGQDNT